MMRRRNFITLLGGAAAAWPLAARAQQGERVRRIGVLTAQSENDPTLLARMAAFRRRHAGAWLRLELLRELVPGATRVAVLVNPANAANTEATLKDVQAAARTMGLQIRVKNASTSREIDVAFATFERERPDALFVGSGPLFSSQSAQLAALAGRYRVPAIFAGRQIVEAGGLMSYGASLTDTIRQAGVYTGRVLKGAKPADMPVEQSTKFELVINVKAAKALGLDVPAHLQQLADEVIE